MKRLFYENKMTDYNACAILSAAMIRTRCCSICVPSWPGTVLVDGDEVELLDTRKQIRRYQLLPILIGILRVVTSLFFHQ